MISSQSSDRHETQSIPMIPTSVPVNRDAIDWKLQTEAVLQRLDSVEQLCRDELAVYSEATVDDKVSVDTAFKLSIVIPVYNEEQTVATVVSRVASLPIRKEIVIVDDCSTDSTFEVISPLNEIPEVHVVRHEVNQGKGAALRTGFQHATGDIVVIQDADLEYDPCDIPKLIEPILQANADVVYGSRFIGEEQQDESWVHRFGNGVLTWVSNCMSGLKLTDMETCYKAFRRTAISDIQVDQDRFGIEPELTAKLARRGYRFVEVPISYNARTYAEGKKIGIKDLFNAIYCIGRYGVSD